MEDQLTPETVKLNEVEPEGFCAEPRILSDEVWKLSREVAAMKEALSRLVDLLGKREQCNGVT
jgi:hypothetical protein